MGDLGRTSFWCAGCVEGGFPVSGQASIPGNTALLLCLLEPMQKPHIYPISLHITVTLVVPCFVPTSGIMIRKRTLHYAFYVFQLLSRVMPYNMLNGRLYIMCCLSPLFVLYSSQCVLKLRVIWPRCGNYQISILCVTGLFNFGLQTAGPSYWYTF